MFVSIRTILSSVLALFALTIVSAADSPRKIISNAILAEPESRKIELITSLVGETDDSIKVLLNAWKEDALYLYESKPGAQVPVQLTGEKDATEAQAAVRVDNGEPLTGANGQPVRLIAGDLTAVEHTSSLRRAMKVVLDLLDLGTPDLSKRLQAIQTIGFGQDLEKIPALEKRLALETEPKARRLCRKRWRSHGSNHPIPQCNSSLSPSSNNSTRFRVTI